MYKEKASYGISKENCSISIYGILDSPSSLLLFDVFIYQMRLAAELFLVVCLLFVALECNSCEANKRSSSASTRKRVNTNQL